MAEITKINKHDKFSNFTSNHETVKRCSFLLPMILVIIKIGNHDKATIKLVFFYISWTLLQHCGQVQYFRNRIWQYVSKDLEKSIPFDPMISALEISSMELVIHK